MKSGNLVCGMDACIEFANKKKIYCIIVAIDSSQRTKDKIKKIGQENHIPVYEYEIIENLSKSIGKRNKAIIGIKDKNLSLQIEKNINGGDSIG